MAHWYKIMADESTVLQTIMFREQVAGNIVVWEREGKRNVGYSLGAKYWGQGIATAALLRFLVLVTDRPLRASVAQENIASIRVLQKCGFTISNSRGSDSAVGDGPAVKEFVLNIEGKVNDELAPAMKPIEL